VRDTGIGLAPEQQATIFEPFVQANSAVTRKFGGTGLGLSISAQLVRLMGGDIAVTSALGAGAQFQFQVDVGVAEAAVVVEQKRGSVLLLETHAGQRGVLVECLTAAGFACQAPPDVAGAVAALHEHSFSHVVIDAGFGGEFALQAMARLSTEPVRTVAVLASFGEGVTRASLTERGISRVLSRPLSGRRLIDALSETVEESAKPALQSVAALRAAPRVLVADDHVVNRKLASSLLQQLGCVVTLAADGLEALDRVKHEIFDLVLMDLQMPALNGYDAVRAVRGWERNAGRAPVPVIAVTAAAMSQDRQRCLEHGMNEVLTKPFSIAALEHVVRRFAAGGGAVPMPALIAEAPPAKVWQHDEALARCGGESTLLAELLAMTRASLPDYLVRLEHASTALDTSAARAICHALRGVLANIAAPQALTLVLACERAAVAGEGAALLGLMPDLRNAVGALGEAITAYLDVDAAAIAA
jgi:CheY-like chemotaxis protein